MPLTDLPFSDMLLWCFILLYLYSVLDFDALWETALRGVSRLSGELELREQSASVSQMAPESFDGGAWEDSS